MILQNSNVVGVKYADPRMPGRMYLAEKGGLTRRIQSAKFLENSSLNKAIEEVKGYSDNIFVTEVNSVPDMI